jgi:hypothetical protein
MKNIIFAFLLLYCFSCSTENSNQENNSRYINTDSIVTSRKINQLLSLEKDENYKLYGVWSIDSAREKNILHYRYTNIDSAFSAFDFKPDNKVYNAKKIKIGIVVKLFGDFKVVGDSIFVYSKIKNTVQGFKFEIKNDTLMELTNGDPIGYKDFPKMKMYLSRMPDYSAESKMKKLNEERIRRLNNK